MSSILNINDWFLALPEGKQKALLEHKWTLASAAHQAGYDLAQAEIAELKDVLSSVKVRITYIGWPSEGFWNIGTAGEPRWVPDWRHEARLVEHCLSGLAYDTLPPIRGTIPAYALDDSKTDAPMPSYEELIDCLASIRDHVSKRVPPSHLVDMAVCYPLSVKDLVIHALSRLPTNDAA